MVLIKYPAGHKTKREFHKITVEVTVLCEDQSGPYDMTLGELARAIVDGDYSGDHKVTKHKVLNGKQMAKALKKQGSDPEFFQIDAKGNDLE